MRPLSGFSSSSPLGLSRLPWLPFALLLCSSATFSSARAADLSLGNAVNAALNNNAEVRTAQANLERAQASDRAMQADPGSLVGAKLGSANTLASAQAGLRGAKLSTLQNTIAAYTALLEAQENAELQTLQVQVDQKSVQVARTKLSIGNATTLEVQQAQNALSGSQQTLADARAQINLASAKLATLTGLAGPLRATGLAAAPKLSTSLAALQGNLGILPALVGASGDLKVAQLNVKLADNDFTPARTLQDARTALANAQRALDTAQRSAAQALAGSYQAAQNAAELYGVAQSRELAAQKAYNQDAARFKSGIISAVDLQNTQLTAKKAQFARLQSGAAVLNALAALSVASGKNLTGVGGL